MARTRAPQNPGNAPADAEIEQGDEALDTAAAPADTGDELADAQAAADRRGRAVRTSKGWVCPTPKLAQPVR